MPSSPNDRTPTLTSAGASPFLAAQHSILIGPLGLRAGWGILLFAVAYFLLSSAILAAVKKSPQIRAEIQRQVQIQRDAEHRVQGANTPPQPPVIDRGFTAIQDISGTGAVLLAALSLSRLEHRHFRVYGLPSPRLRDLLAGAAWGLAGMALLIAALRSLHLLVFDRPLLNGPGAVLPGTEWLAIFFFVGLFEETFFRGYLQFTLTRGLLHLAAAISPRHTRAVAFSLSALIWSLLFSITHIANGGETLEGLLAVFFAGVLFSYALWRTGSLWWGIGLHTTWDWAQSFLFGVPDSGTLATPRLFQTHPAGNALFSGGVAGPEGSLLLLPVFLLLAAAIRFHPQAAQPPVEPFAPTLAERVSPAPIP